MIEKHAKLCDCDQCKSNRKLRDTIIKNQNKKVRQKRKNALKRGKDWIKGVKNGRYTD